MKQLLKHIATFCFAILLMKGAMAATPVVGVTLASGNEIVLSSAEQEEQQNWFLELLKSEVTESEEESSLHKKKEPGQQPFAFIPKCVFSGSVRFYQDHIHFFSHLYLQAHFSGKRQSMHELFSLLPVYLRNEVFRL